MPGYVMHLAEAGLILDEIERQTELRSDWKQRFLTGTLLPDTRLKDEKFISHFWNPEKRRLLALAPDLALFLKKYEDRLSDPIVLGYLAHLHLDKAYVDTYWPTVIAFYGSAGEPEVVRERITSVEIKHLNKRVPVDRFFSPEYYYGEYTKMNGYFIDKYALTIPDWEKLSENPVDEVSLQDMRRISRELGCLLKNCHTGDEGHIQIFDLNMLEAFLAETAHLFVHLYGRYAGHADRVEQ